MPRLLIDWVTYTLGAAVVILSLFIMVIASAIPVFVVLALIKYLTGN